MTELWLRESVALIREGGWVFVPLLALAFGIFVTLLSILSLLQFPEAPALPGNGWRALLRRSSLTVQDLRLASPCIGGDLAAKELERRLFAKLRRRIPFALTLISAAPLLGLLGTVSGMLATFHGLSIAATRAPVDVISGGVSEALITTQAGLVIGVPSFLVCAILKSRVERYELGFKRLVAAASTRRLPESVISIR